MKRGTAVEVGKGDAGHREFDGQHVALRAVYRAPSDYPSGEEGDVLTVEFTVAGVACIGLNGGPVFKHNEAFSFQIATDDQQETDRYWNAIVGNGGEESAVRLVQRQAGASSGKSRRAS